MYRVIVYFTDLQDGNHPYNVGDIYPREGVNPTEARCNELASTSNLRKMPLIERIKGESVEVRGSDKSELIEETEKPKRKPKKHDDE